MSKRKLQWHLQSEELGSSTNPRFFSTIDKYKSPITERLTATLKIAQSNPLNARSCTQLFVQVVMIITLNMHEASYQFK